ncbi:unnamed protein product [Pleuronectes platessa]|uniref:Uncharacterized protein n=1 Tax=Pleuronectes platessa TaxID=8262 RepID=A0A9N7W1H7_PLEPL|nr:unnamed protein product [Pleuronectes platessa]
MQSSVGVSVTRASTHPASPFHSVHWRNEEVRYTRACLSLEEEPGDGRGGESRRNQGDGRGGKSRRNQGMGEEERTGVTRGWERRREQEEPGDGRGGENRWKQGMGEEERTGGAGQYLLCEEKQKTKPHPPEEERR